MKSEKLIFAVLGTIIKAALLVAAVYIIYRGAILSYDYGYRILTEPPMSAGEGRKISIDYKADMSALELGKLMEQKGLTRDGKLFALQYLFSEYRKDLKPGTYEVSTAMTAEEILASMAPPADEKKK